MADRKVLISVTRTRRLKCTPAQVRVKPGERIVWAVKKNYPFGVMVKSPFTPLDRHFYLSGLRPSSPKVIKARVLSGAPPGHYPYGVGVFDGKKLLVDDPEIIVKRPGGGR